MQSKKNIIEAYNKTAIAYAHKFINELDGKPLDRLLLKLFADDNKHKGKVIDLGCGPGHIARFLADCGCEDIIGADISPAMITEAKTLNPRLNFEIADMLNLHYTDNEFGAAVAFYSIVNFDYPAIKTAFTQVNRILKPGGQFLFSFHTGDEVVHLDEFLDEKVAIDFYFLNVDKIIALLKETGFKVIEALTRFPYETEHQTQRAYIKAVKN